EIEWVTVGPRDGKGLAVRELAVTVVQGDAFVALEQVHHRDTSRGDEVDRSVVVQIGGSDGLHVDPFEEPDPNARVRENEPALVEPRSDGLPPGDDQVLLAVAIQIGD